MAAATYFLCALTALACCGLLWRAWRANRSSLLFWSALCFAFLAANNVLLVVDKIVFVETDLRFWRLLTALVAVMLLLHGLTREDDES